MFFRKCLFFLDLFLFLLCIILSYKGHQFGVVLLKLNFRLVQYSSPTVLFFGQLSYLLLHSFVSQFSMKHLLFLVDEFINCGRALFTRELDARSSNMHSCLNIAALARTKIKVQILVFRGTNVGVPYPS